MKCKNHPATLIDFCVWCHWACSQRVTTFAEIRLDLSIDCPPLLILIIGQESLLTDYLAVISADVRNYFQYICWGVFARLWKRSCRRVLPARHCTDEQIASRFSWTLNNRKLLVFKVIRIIWFLSRSMMGPVGVQKERYRISLKFPLKYIPFMFM